MTEPLISFEWPVRVYMEDTDAGGIVFYVNYLKYMERARTECLRRFGFDKTGIFNRDAMFVVHSMQLAYKAPAQLDECLIVEAHIIQLKRSSVIFRQNVYRDDELLCEAQVKIACVDRVQMKPVAIPDIMYQTLKNPTLDRD